MGNQRTAYAAVDRKNGSIDRGRNNYPSVAGDAELDELAHTTINERSYARTLDERRRIDDLAPEAELSLGGEQW